jgi:2-amino-4-hydroxy-6-hydroxymethyldihydropteridine diphosphokinase
MHTAYLSIGSNIEKDVNLRRCMLLLKKITSIEKSSQVYETKPLHDDKQENFLNSAVKIQTDLSPGDLLKALKTIEKKLKRVKNRRYGPRTIDLDILLYDKKIIKTKTLTIPHEKMHQRAFVLRPLKEIASNVKHPLLKKTINQLYQEIKGEKQRFKRAKLSLF